MANVLEQINSAALGDLCTRL